MAHEAEWVAKSTPYFVTAPMDGANFHRPWAEWSTAERAAEIERVGDPAHDCHTVDDRLRDWGDEAVGERLVSAFHHGYRRSAGTLPAGRTERDPVYEGVQLLGTAGFFDKHVEYSDESRAEAAERLEREMDARLDAIQ